MAGDLYGRSGVRPCRPKLPDSDRRTGKRSDRDIDGRTGELEPDLAPAAQFDIDLRQQLGVEQRAVLHAVTAIDPVAGAQRVKRQLGARMATLRQGDRVDHAAETHRLQPAEIEL